MTNFKDYCYISGSNLKAIFWFKKNGYSIERYWYPSGDPDVDNCTFRYYYKVSDKDNVWNSADDFHKFLVGNDLLESNYKYEPTEYGFNDVAKFYGLTLSDYFTLRDYDWSTSKENVYDLRDRVMSHLGL